VLTPAKPGEPPSIDDLRQFARARLSAYKVPRIFEIRDSLPRSATGKLLRHVVESEAREDSGNDAS
jgi:feruloyl-CoA synthase